MIDVSTLTIVQIFMDSTFYGCLVMLFTVSNVVLDKQWCLLEVQSQKSSEEQNAILEKKNTLKFWRTLGIAMLALTTLVS